MKLKQILEGDWESTVFHVNNEIWDARNRNPKKFRIRAINKMTKAFNAGFKIKAYHGTVSDFKTFTKGDLGYHFGSADQAWYRIVDKGGRDMARIMPVLLRIKKAAYTTDAGDWTNPRDVIHAITLPDVIKKFPKEMKEELEKVREEIHQKTIMSEKACKDYIERIAIIFLDYGYNAIVYPNTGEGTGEKPSYLMFNSRDIVGLYDNF
jgi:hypothetical protein